MFSGCFLVRLKKPLPPNSPNSTSHFTKSVAENLFAESKSPGYFSTMSTVQEIEAVIPRLSRPEVEELRVWIEDYLEDQLELTDAVKAQLAQSRQEIAAGQYTTRQPK